jgi:hypothetical protein
MNNRYGDFDKNGSRIPCGQKRKSHLEGGFQVGCDADEFLGWLMGLEPTTTGITILDSTN